MIRDTSALNPRAFEYGILAAPIYKKASYRITLGTLFVLALIFISFAPSSGLLMLFAVFLSFGGAYAGGKSSQKLTPGAPSSFPKLLPKVLRSSTVYGSSGISLIIYLSSFLSALGEASASGQGASFATGTVTGA